MRQGGDNGKRAIQACQFGTSQRYSLTLLMERSGIAHLMPIVMMTTMPLHPIATAARAMLRPIRIRLSPQKMKRAGAWNHRQLPTVLRQTMQKRYASVQETSQAGAGRDKQWTRRKTCLVHAEVPPIKSAGTCTGRPGTWNSGDACAFSHVYGICHSHTLRCGKHKATPMTDGYY